MTAVYALFYFFRIVSCRFLSIEAYRGNPNTARFRTSDTSPGRLFCSKRVRRETSVHVTRAPSAPCPSTGSNNTGAGADRRLGANACARPSGLEASAVPDVRQEGRGGSSGRKVRSGLLTAPMLLLLVLVVVVVVAVVWFVRCPTSSCTYTTCRSRIGVASLTKSTRDLPYLGITSSLVCTYHVTAL